jgi:GAF domain-containing protein
MGRESDVIQALVGLADSLVLEVDPPELLQLLVDDCVRLLDVTAAGLLLAGEDGRLQVAAASSERMRALEVVQVSGDQGPCLEAYSRGERVVAGDPAGIEDGWADFAADVSAAGFRSVVAVPMRLRSRRIGALGLFSEREGMPTPADVDVAQAFADIATIAVLQQQAVHDAGRVSAQLQHALDSRVLVEQAKGVVATQTGSTVAEAFRVLRDHARARGLTLSDVAQDVVAGRLTADDLQRRDAGHRAPGPG